MITPERDDEPKNGAGLPGQEPQRENDTRSETHSTSGGLFAPTDGGGPAPTLKRPRKPRLSVSACADAHEEDATPPAPSARATPPLSQDPFDLGGLRLSQNFAESVGVKKRLITVPVRKPNRQEFIRVRPGEAWRLQTLVLELKEERENYLVTPSLASEVGGEATPKVLLTTMNRQGVCFLWPVKLPGEDGRHDEWNASALEAAKIAESKWTRVAANMSLGAYDVSEAVANLPEPEWPDVTFQELIRIGFKGRLVDNSDHPVLRRLRGET